MIGSEGQTYFYTSPSSYLTTCNCIEAHTTLYEFSEKDSQLQFVF